MRGGRPNADAQGQAERNEAHPIGALCWALVSFDAVATNDLT
jgi:hypothetical protein